MLKAILLKVEESDNIKEIKVSNFPDTMDPDEIFDHMKHLLEEKLVEGRKLDFYNQARGDIAIKSITSKGHNFLDSIRNQEV